MYKLLVKIRELRRSKKDVKADLAVEIAPLKVAITEASAPFVVVLRDCEDAEQRLLAQFRAQWAALNAQRRNALLSGSAAEQIELPLGVIVRNLIQYQITDAAKIPREFLTPDLAAIKKAGGCSGVARVLEPCVVCK
jgi:hypothetical protein